MSGVDNNNDVAHATITEVVDSVHTPGLLRQGTEPTWVPVPGGVPLVLHNGNCERCMQFAMHIAGPRLCDQSLIDAEDAARATMIQRHFNNGWSFPGERGLVEDCARLRDAQARIRELEERLNTEMVSRIRAEEQERLNTEILARIRAEEHLRLAMDQRDYVSEQLARETRHNDYLERRLDDAYRRRDESSQVIDPPTTTASSSHTTSLPAPSASTLLRNPPMAAPAASRRREWLSPADSRPWSIGGRGSIKIRPPLRRRSAVMRIAHSTSMTYEHTSNCAIGLRQREHRKSRDGHGSRLWCTYYLYGVYMHTSSQSKDSMSRPTLSLPWHRYWTLEYHPETLPNSWNPRASSPLRLECLKRTQ